MLSLLLQHTIDIVCFATVNYVAVTVCIDTDYFAGVILAVTFWLTFASSLYLSLVSYYLIESTKDHMGHWHVDKNRFNEHE